MRDSQTARLAADARPARRAATRALDGRSLVMVSNREPYRRIEEGGEEGWLRTTGGLVSALDPLMRECDGTWIAWSPGGAADEMRRSRVPGKEPGFTMLEVPLSEEEVAAYYEGFANRALWPLCHYFVDRYHFDEDEWDAYRRVNRRFAEAVLAEAGPDDLVWIHDYHFCLLPEQLRRRGLTAPIAFFLHIPFPAEEVFQIFPWRRELLAGLLGADLVGFHCSSYVRNFLTCCRELLGARVDTAAGTVEWRGRSVRVAAFPIGVSVEEFEELAREPEIRQRAREIRRRVAAEKIILGVDRLDYSKGIPARLRAIDALFSRHPEHRRRVSFVQVAVPSRSRVREYQEIKRRIDELVGRINGRHGDAEWQPIRYTNDGLGREELVANYLAADVCLVTPLRDGMNLVALEYCLCRPQGEGVLVLSEFAGAAELLAGTALVVNPFAVHEVAETLHRALTMPAGEQARRLAAARSRIVHNDGRRWLATVLEAIAGGATSWAA